MAAEVLFNEAESTPTSLQWTLRLGGGGGVGSLFTLTLSKTEEEEEEEEDDDDGENYPLKEIDVTLTVNRNDSSYDNFEVLTREKPRDTSYKALQYVNLDNPNGLPITVLRRGSQGGSNNFDGYDYYHNFCSETEDTDFESCYYYEPNQTTTIATNPTDTMRLAMDSMALLLS
ncbi:hypothetical protein TYRP_011893 [Tyrophagus putrescentiae]|nr:hypothetical protein TYRP_011893 [Tyrophagus putrescentiae]